MDAAARHDPPAGRWVELPVLIAALLLVADMAFTGSGLAGTVQAQAEPGTIPSLTLASSEPGQLVITWETADPKPTDYRPIWGNVYPASDETTLTPRSLSRGKAYKVQPQVRNHNEDRSFHLWSGPWTPTITARDVNHL